MHEDVAAADFAEQVDGCSVVEETGVVEGRRAGMPEASVSVLFGFVVYFFLFYYICLNCIA